MFTEVRKRSRKAGQPPGTLTYTGGKKNIVPEISFVEYGDDIFYEKTGRILTDVVPESNNKATQWLNLVGLSDIDLLKDIAKRYDLHPLTLEDILNGDQRPKVEEFDHYIFITIKVIEWVAKKNNFQIRQLSIIVGDHFVLSFQEEPSQLFANIYERLRKPQQGLSKKTCDYLAYRLLDIVVDHYFIVLEGLGNLIEKCEDIIIKNPVKQSEKSLYRLRRQILVLRKAIWPTRDVFNHLFKLENKIFSNYSYIYLRDVYDHTVQAIDTIDVFREMLANMLDIYLSSLTNRMNEIIKVLTIIATTFIPVTFIASIYGMNFQHMPELQWKYSYPCVLGFMLFVIALMFYYFRRKNWW